MPNQANGYGSTFRIRSNFNLGWSLNDWSVNWGLRYFSGTKEPCYFDDRCNLPDFSAPETQGNIDPQNRTGAVTFHDLQVSYAAPWNASISVGANNVFNKVGPAMYAQPNSSFSYYGGFDIGRFYYLKYTQRF